MFGVITVCFILSFSGITLVYILGFDDKWVYLSYVNNLCNPVIYYWLNKEFRGDYNDVWRRVWTKLKNIYNCNYE